MDKWGALWPGTSAFSSMNRLVVGLPCPGSLCCRCGPSTMDTFWSLQADLLAQFWALPSRFKGNERVSLQGPLGASYLDEQDLGESSENFATGDNGDSLGFKVAKIWAQTLFLLPLVMYPLPSYY